jgi:SAM-dependent methyltransferase
MPATTSRPTTDAQQVQVAACPVCENATDDFFHLPRLPADIGVLCDSAESARVATMGEVTLAHCAHCDFIFNRTFQPQRLHLVPGYEVQLVHSGVFREFLEGVAERLIGKYQLHGKRLLDVGCGAGHFLRLLCEGGGNHGVGVDPTVPNEAAVKLSAGEMRFVRSLFDEQASRRLGDFEFATCQSVLENVPNPVRFLFAVRRCLLNRRGYAYFEVFNARRAFAAGEVWSITYEQCNYYSLDSFHQAIRRAGFFTTEAGTCFGDGQYLYVEGAAVRPPSAPLPPAAGQHPASITQFAELHAQRLAYWQERIASLRAAGHKAAVWGTGGKGVCFLNTVGASDVFAWAVDINPDRQNRYVPGSGQPIVSPAQLPVLRPDAIVITNPLYESEIRTAASELNLNCEFLTI